MEIVKTEDIREKATDSLSTIKVSSGMEQVNVRCDISVKEAGFEFVKCETSPELGKKTYYDTEMRIKTEAKDEVNRQENRVNYKHQRSIKTGDCSIDCEQIAGKEDNVVISVKEAGSMKCEMNPREEETTCSDTRIRIERENEDEVNYEPLISIRIGDYKIEPDQECMEHTTTDRKCILLNKLGFDHRINVNEVETIKHERIVGKEDTASIEVCTDKQNAVQEQCKPNYCECEYKTGGVGEYKLKIEADLVKHCKYKNNIEEHNSLLPDNSNIKVTRDENAELYQCSCCGFKARDKRYLLEYHKWKHDSAAEIFYCELCDFITKTKSNLLQHHRLRHEDSAEVFVCKFCDYKTKTKTYLLQHHKIKHDPREFIHCKLCDFKTKNKSYLSRHHKSKHGDASGIFHCELCDFKTKYRCNFLEHRTLKHFDATESFCCVQCDFKTKYKYNLLKHYRTMHDDAAKIYHCDQCDYKTKNKNSFSNHHRLSHN